MLPGSTLMVLPCATAAPAGSVYDRSIPAWTTSPPPPPAAALGSPSNCSTTTVAGPWGFCTGSAISTPFSPGGEALTSPLPLSSRVVLTAVAAGTCSRPSFGQSNTIAYHVLPLRVIVPHFGGAASANVVP